MKVTVCTVGMSAPSYRADQQRADAVDAEDLFGDDRAGEGGRQAERDNGNHRDHAVAQQHVHEDHQGLRPPVGARGGHYHSA